MSFDKMMLFGSYARGTQREDSDVDVAIIVDEMQGDYFSTRPLLWRIRREVDDRIEPVLLETKHDTGFLKTGRIQPVCAGVPMLLRCYRCGYSAHSFPRRFTP